jgi:hypothetical protein
MCTSASWSPLSFAWAFAIPGFVAAHPSLSRIKSIERFSTFWRLCINSSDCVANENECRDSEGNRERSSPKANVGDPGAVGAESEGCLDTGGVAIFNDVARCVEGGNREPPCWRMRRRPEAPMPCSCSGTMGDLKRMCQPLLNTCPAACLIPHLVMRSSCPASKLMRFPVSIAGGPLALSRLEVLWVLASGT